MGYDIKKWKKRMYNRSDMSINLIHLTKKNEDLSALDVLFKILKEKLIIASSGKGFIIGNDAAVCFQDAPLYSVSQNVYHEVTFRKELGDKTRYSAYGLAFYKPDLYFRGARPVFYENKETAKKMLSENEWWRIVALEFKNKETIIDWTHEREWRFKGDFKFSWTDATIILPDTNAYRKFIKEADTEMLGQLSGIVVLTEIL
jgi:hypothetical protein